jgi:hypothetical protein
MDAMVASLLDLLDGATSSDGKTVWLWTNRLPTLVRRDDREGEAVEAQTHQVHVTWWVLRNPKEPILTNRARLVGEDGVFGSDPESVAGYGTG